jgi:peptidoglycan/xylan/chitin deacetylase (PgdA/CDA1 family)
MMAAYDTMRPSLKNIFPTLFIVVAAMASGATADGATPTASIALFDGNRSAAISYTFDDNLRDQYTLAVPMLNEVGFKGTFFVIPGATAETPEQAKAKEGNVRAWGSISWPELKEMDAEGHEIASHTWSHPNLTKLSAEEVDAQFRKAYDAIKMRIGQPPLTLAFPFNADTPEVQVAALKYHVAYRSYQTGTSGKSTVDSLNTWADKQVKEQTWGVIMAHAIGSGYAALSDPEILRAHLKYVKSRERDIWVDTFANIARYVKERDNTRLTLTGEAGNVVCVRSSTLDPHIYNVPLTIVFQAVGAQSARAVCEGRELPVRIDNNAIYVRATPGIQPIALTWK